MLHCSRRNGNFFVISQQWQLYYITLCRQQCTDFPNSRSHCLLNSFTISGFMHLILINDHIINTQERPFRDSRQISKKFKKIRIIRYSISIIQYKHTDMQLGKQFALQAQKSLALSNFINVLFIPVSDRDCFWKYIYDTARLLAAHFLYALE